MQSPVTSSVAFYHSPAICWKNWHPLKSWLFSWCLSFLPSKLLPQTGSCLWCLLAPFVRLFILKYFKVAKVVFFPWPYCCKRAVRGRDRPILSMQNAAEDIQERDGGVTRLIVCRRPTDLAVALLKGILPPFNVPFLPHPQQCYWYSSNPDDVVWRAKTAENKLVFSSSAKG